MTDSEPLACPKCGAENIGKRVHIQSVTDERGTHYECSVCAHSWTTKEKDLLRRRT